jgi:hypothetical protein
LGSGTFTVTVLTRRNKTEIISEDEDVACAITKPGESRAFNIGRFRNVPVGEDAMITVTHADTLPILEICDNWSVL